MAEYRRHLLPGDTVKHSGKHYCVKRISDYASADGRYADRYRRMIEVYPVRNAPYVVPILVDEGDCEVVREAACTDGNAGGDLGLETEDLG